MENQNNSKKYRDLLSAARELFWKHGFRRVSVEEICSKAGISKMTFYRFFPNKVELAKSVLDDIMDSSIQKYKDIMSEDTPFPDKIGKIVMLKFEGTTDISQEFLMDFYKSQDLGLKGYLDDKINNAWKFVLNDFRSAQEKGWFRKDFKPEFLFYLSQKFSEMVFDEKLRSLYGSPQELIMEMTRFFAYGVSPYNEE
jgi:AcrR family transcriptional regulator